MASRFVGHILVVCAMLLLAGCYEVGGTVSGLQGSGLVLQNSNGEQLAITGNGAFAFNWPLRNSQDYSVTVVTQPTNPAQVCTVNNGAGTHDGNQTVSNVQVVCASATASVSVTVSGLVSTGLVLQNNGDDSLPIATNGTFPFPTTLSIGTAYEVVVQSQPAQPVAQICSVTNGTGVVTASGANIAISCRTRVGKFVYLAALAAPTLTGFSINQSGQLSAVPGSPYATAASPASISIHGSERFLYLGHLTGGVISGFAVDSTSGSLSAVPGSPFVVASASTTPLANMAISPNGAFGYSPSGPTGLVYGVTIDQTSGALTPIATTAIGRGTQPGFFSRDGSYFYSVLLPVGSPSSPSGIVAHSIASTTGALTEVAGSPYATGGSSPTNTTMHPNGLYYYTINYGTANTVGSIAAFEQNSVTGSLTSIAGSPYPIGLSPLAANIHPSGKFLYVANSSRTVSTPPVLGVPPTFTYGPGSLSAFAIDEATGQLTELPGSPVATGQNGSAGPKLDPFGKFLYIANIGSGSISSYAVDQSTGALVPVAGSPFPTGEAPGFAMDPSGLYLYVAQPVAALLKVFAADPATGVLTLVDSKPAAAGQPKVLGLN